MIAVTAPDDWSGTLVPASRGGSERGSGAHPVDDSANGGVRREPELAEHEDIAPEPPKHSPEFEFGEDEADEDAVRARALRATTRGLARQAALDPGDGIDL
jgi:type IV secretion system protein VirD4